MNHLAKIFFLITLSLGLMTCWRSPLVEGVAKAGSEDEESINLAPLALLNLMIGNSSSSQNNCDVELSGSIIYQCAENGQWDICKADLSGADCSLGYPGRIESQNLMDVEYSYYASSRSDLQPQYFQSINKVIFYSERDYYNGTLYAMNPDGSGVIKLGTDANRLRRQGYAYYSGYAYAICWQGGLTTITFAQMSGLCRVPLPGGATEFLLRSDLDGLTNARSNPVTDEAHGIVYMVEESYAVSRPGVTGLRWYNVTNATTGKYLMPADTNERLLILPDGSLILPSDDGTNENIVRFYPDTQTIVRLTSSPERGSWHSKPELSPDKTKVLYFDRYPTSVGWHVMDIDGTNDRLIPESDQMNHFGAWHPAGDRLLLANSSGYDATWYVYDLNTDKRVRVLFQPEMFGSYTGSWWKHKYNWVE